VITQQPRDLTVRAGSNAVFTVIAEGTPPLTYQWFFNGAAMPGSRQSSLILTNVQTMNAGDYRVMVTNLVGSVTSVAVKLAVEAGQPVGPKGFAWIPPGTFVMGSPASEEGRFTNEIQRSVTLTQGFWLSDHEVTQEEYQEVMSRNSSRFTGNLNRPVEQVSWFEAVEYCQKLTARERAANRITIHQVYRLPTEAEWEYAARAGTTSARHGDLNLIAWHFSNSVGETHSVRQKKPNAWGLYDMMGNVWEWCSDWYADYPVGSTIDPMGPSTGSFKLVRGGSWNRVDRNVRSASRSGSEPEIRSDVIGFRPALSSPVQ
jgi:formylglycine-generating enzyme required for sulfatase activity